MLRLDEYLRVGRAITSMDGRTEAALDEQCNLVVTRFVERGEQLGVKVR